MPSYTPPLRDMQFVLHEVFHIADELKAMPTHAETDADTSTTERTRNVSHPPR